MLYAALEEKNCDVICIRPIDNAIVRWRHSNDRKNPIVPVYFTRCYLMPTGGQGQCWITHCACSYVTREALALGREWTVRGWIRLRSKFFLAKLAQLHYVYFDLVQARTCWHKEDKCLNWNSRLVEEVEVDCTRSLVCGAMWKFLVYRRIKTTSTCRKTVNKLIWEQIWLNLQDRRFDIWEKKTEFNGKKWS